MILMCSLTFNNLTSNHTKLFKLWCKQWRICIRPIQQSKIMEMQQHVSMEHPQWHRRPVNWSIHPPLGLMGSDMDQRELCLPSSLHSAVLWRRRRRTISCPQEHRYTHVWHRFTQTAKANPFCCSVGINLLVQFDNVFCLFVSLTSDSRLDTDLGFCPG